MMLIFWALKYLPPHPKKSKLIKKKTNKKNIILASLLLTKNTYILLFFNKFSPTESNKTANKN